ncbi:MAG: DUF4238 domain-containing protein [Candidatus Helarchaeota archaeon]
MNCHWVPVVYLKNFGFNISNQESDPRNEMIFYFNKSTIKEKINNANIQEDILNDICSEEDFYNTNLEKFFSIKVETNYLDKAFTKIISEKSIKSLTEKEKTAIKQFILSQKMRTPAAIRKQIELNIWLKSLPREIYDKCVQSGIFKYIPQENLATCKEGIIESYVKDIILAARFPSLLDDFKWILRFNKTNLSFFTSDNPIIDYSGINFWYSKITEFSLGKQQNIILPINPKIILVLTKNINTPERDLYDISLNKWSQIFSNNNKIIRNAENFVLMDTKNVKLIQKCIDIDKKCLQKKHNIYKIIKKPSEDNLHIKHYKKAQESVHNKRRTIKCTECARLFKTELDLKKHLRDSHEINF